MNALRSILGALLAILVLSLILGGFYCLRETEQAIITEFGRPVGAPVTEPGLHWKKPLIQTVNRLEKRVLEWDGPPNEMPTKDKTYIEVDTFARWRISDPTQFFVRITDERSARSRLDDIIGSEVRTAVARHELIEIVRSDKKREPLKDDTLKKMPSGSGGLGSLPAIQFGRLELEKDIKKLSAEKLAELGIELMDIRFKRINYNPQVLERIYQRMISERQQIASRFRSEGEGEGARILGKKERDLNEIDSGAYKQVQTIQGEADAEATRIYAESFNKSAQATEFYEYVKTLETYRKVLAGNSTLVLSTDSDLFRLLKKARPSPPPPAPPQ
jgi:membrane protease subunit HflC